jgi:hypothetical protein
MTYWAVSDLNAADLADLSKLLREKKPETPEK